MQSEEIRDIRKTLGLTQEGLARKLNISFQTINRWESGKFKPSPMALEKLKKLKKGRE